MGKPKNIQKKDLVHAAKQQLLSQGQGNVTLKSVADAAGVTQGVIYYHFKTKQQLLLSLIEQYEEELEKQVLVGQSLKDTLTKEMYNSQISSDNQRFLTELAALSFNHKELKQRLGQAMRKRIQLYSEVMEGKKLHGRLLTALIDGLALQSVMDPTFPEREMYQLALEVLDALEE
ncbi:MAG TPA: TetR/AcrR family transcriptional regulator [Bacillota bacterium]|nr:TetR/AcrR family transcriptional regulator [Bacillota bacterium]